MPWRRDRSPMKVLKSLNLDLPEGSIILADKAFTGYDYDVLL